MDPDVASHADLFALILQLCASNGMEPAEVANEISDSYPDAPALADGLGAATAALRFALGSTTLRRIHVRRLLKSIGHGDPAFYGSAECRIRERIAIGW